MRNNTFYKVFGRVQGVGYRAWTKNTAKKYSLTGWVKNCNDETVEIEINGNESKKKKFLKECYMGPIFSKVTKIESYDVIFKKFRSFEILY